jgi:hypothetical protein
MRDEEDRFQPFPAFTVFGQPYALHLVQAASLLAEANDTLMSRRYHR